MKKYKETWYPKNRERQLRLLKERRLREKSEVMEYYGGGECTCCGEKKLTFLTLDHAWDDGAEHRRIGNKKISGHKMYSNIIKQGFPTNKGYQVLCWNCNSGRS